MTNRTLEAAEIAKLAKENARLQEAAGKLMIAYHVAICSPKGVVPVDEFYDPAMAHEIEQSMTRARATLAERSESE